MNAKIVLEEGYKPVRKTDGAAGYDLYVPQDTEIKYGRQVIPLGFRIQLPDNCEGEITARSGCSVKGIEGTDGKMHDADVLVGHVDSDYTGIVGVIIYSKEKEPFVVRKGYRIAQMIIRRYEVVRLLEAYELNNTERGEGGYGHTGSN